MVKRTERAAVQGLVLLVGLTGGIGFACADETNLPGPASPNAESAQEGVSLQAFQSGQARAQAQLQHRTAVENARGPAASQPVLPSGTPTPNGDKILYFVGSTPDDPNLGSTYLAIYNVATGTTQYKRIPEGGYYYYSGHKIEAVSQTYALAAFIGRLYAVNLQDLSQPPRFVTVPEYSSAGIEGASFLNDKTAAVVSGDYLKKVYFLSLDSMTLTKSPTSLGIATPQGDKTLSVTATVYNFPEFGSGNGLKFLLAVYDVRTKTTQYKSLTGVDPAIGVLGLLQFEIDAVSPDGNSVIVRGPNDTAYIFATRDSNRQPQWVVQLPGYGASSTAVFLNNRRVKIFDAQGRKLYRLNVKTRRVNDLK